MKTAQYSKNKILFVTLVSVLVILVALAGKSVTSVFAGQGQGYNIPSSSSPIYRTFQLKTGDHLYTGSLGEKNNSVSSVGYSDEAIGLLGYLSPAAGSVPIYRLYNPKSGCHFFSANLSERDTAMSSAGYVSEAIGFYDFRVDTDAASSVFSIPVYRLFNITTGCHLYTESTGEYSSAQSVGYTPEGIAFWAPNQ